MRRRYTYRTLKQLGRFAVPAVGLGVVGYLLISGAIPTRSRVLDMLDFPALAALVGSALGHLVDAFWSYYEISDESLRICKINLGTQNVNAVVPWDNVVFGGVTGGELRLILSGKPFTIPSRVSDFDDLTREIRIRATGKLPDASSDLVLKVKSEETARLIIWEIQQDMKINAIKRYRDATGVGLKQAKDDVESIALALKSGQPVPSPLVTRGVAVSPSQRTLSESALARVQDEIRRNRLIPAIKIIREETGMGLKDARDFAEDLQRRMS